MVARRAWETLDRRQRSGVDGHPLDHLDAHAQAVLAQQVAEHFAIDQIDRRRAVTNGLAARFGGEGPGGQDQPLSARPTIAPRKPRTVEEPTEPCQRLHWKITWNDSRFIRCTPVPSIPPSPVLPVTSTLENPGLRRRLLSHASAARGPQSPLSGAKKALNNAVDITVY